MSSPTIVFLILASILDSVGPGSALGEKGKKMCGLNLFFVLALATRGFFTAEDSVFPSS